MAAKNGIVPLPSSKWNTTGLTGIENYATSDESEHENSDPLPTIGKQKPSKPSTERDGGTEPSRLETDRKSSLLEKDIEDRRNKTEDCQTKLKNWISRTSGNTTKLGENKDLKTDRGENGKHGDRRSEEKGRKEDKSRYLARDRRESKGNDDIYSHGKGGSHNESKRHESSGKDKEESRHRHGSSSKDKEELRHRHGSSGKDRKELRRSSHESSSKDRTAFLSHKPESSGKDDKESRHRHGSSGKDKEVLRRLSHEAFSNYRNDLISRKPESSGKNKEESRQRHGSSGKDKEELRHGHSSSGKDKEESRHRHLSSGKDKEELRRLSYETFSKDRKDISHKSSSKDEAGYIKDGRHNESRKSNTKEDEKRREDVKIKKLSRPNTEYFNQMIAKGKHEEEEMKKNALRDLEKHNEKESERKDWKQKEKKDEKRRESREDGRKEGREDLGKERREEERKRSEMKKELNLGDSLLGLLKFKTVSAQKPRSQDSAQKPRSQDSAQKPRSQDSAQKHSSVCNPVPVPNPVESELSESQKIRQRLLTAHHNIDRKSKPKATEDNPEKLTIFQRIEARLKAEKSQETGRVEDDTETRRIESRKSSITEKDEDSFPVNFSKKSTKEEKRCNSIISIEEGEVSSNQDSDNNSKSKKKKKKRSRSPKKKKKKKKDLKKEAFDITFKKLKLKAEKSKARIKRREAKMALKKKNRSLVSDSSDSSKSSESDTSTDSEAMSKSDITEKRIKVEREESEKEDRDLEKKKKTPKRRSRSKDRNGSSKVKIKTEDTSFSDDSEDSSRACSKIKEDEFGPVLVDFRCSNPQSSSRETVHKITNPRSSSRETVHKISSSRETVHKIKKEPRESADESKLHRSKGSSLKDNIERRLLRKRRRSSSVVSDGKSRRYGKESRHSRRSSSRQRSRNPEGVRSNSRRIHGRYSSKEKRELSVYSDGSEIEFIEEVSNKSIQPNASTELEKEIKNVQSMLIPTYKSQRHQIRDYEYDVKPKDEGRVDSVSIEIVEEDAEETKTIIYKDIDLESIPIPEPCSPDIPEKQDTERRVVRRVEDHEETDEKPEHYEEEVVVEEVVEEDVVVASAEDKKLFDSMMNNLINTRTEAEKEKGEQSFSAKLKYPIGSSQRSDGTQFSEHSEIRRENYRRVEEARFHNDEDSDSDEMVHNKDCGRFDKEEKSRYVKDEESRYVKEEESRYVKDEKSRYVKEEESRYAKKEESRYVKEEESRYVKEEDEDESKITRGRCTQSAGTMSYIQYYKETENIKNERASSSNMEENITAPSHRNEHLEYQDSRRRIVEDRYDQFNDQTSSRRRRNEEDLYERRPVENMGEPERKYQRVEERDPYERQTYQQQRPQENRYCQPFGSRESQEYKGDSRQQGCGAGRYDRYTGEEEKWFEPKPDLLGNARQKLLHSQSPGIQVSLRQKITFGLGDRDSPEFQIDLKTEVQRPGSSLSRSGQPYREDGPHQLFSRRTAHDRDGSQVSGSSGEQSWHGREEDIDNVSSRRTSSRRTRWEPDNTNLIPRQRQDVKSRLGTVGGKDQSWNNTPDLKPGYNNSRWRNQENLDTPHPSGSKEQNYRGGRNFGGNPSWRDGDSENHRTPTHKTKARERVFRMLNDQNSKNKVMNYRHEANRKKKDIINLASMYQEQDETLAGGLVFDKEDPGSSSWERVDPWEANLGQKETGLKVKLEPKPNFIQQLNEELDGEVFTGGVGENEWEYVKDDLRWDDRYEPISDEMHDYNLEQLRKKESEIIIKMHGIPISQHDLLTLTGLRWLNDQIIEFYLQMVAIRSKEESYKTLRFPSVYPMNTYFFTRLCLGGYEKVKNWTKNVDIFSYDMLCIPVHHMDIHWAVIIVDFRVPGVFYYDSLQGEDEDVILAKSFLSQIINYLKDEYMDKKNLQLDLSKYVKEVVDNCPQQENGSDCGLFVCKVVEYLSRDVQLKFTQNDMPYFRQRMIWEIGNNSLKST